MQDSLRRIAFCLMQTMRGASASVGGYPSAPHDLLRFKFGRFGISPSVSLRLTPSSSEEGRGYEVLLAPSDEGAGCALAQTEGEKLFRRTRFDSDSIGALSLLSSNLRFDTFLVRGRQGLRRSLGPLWEGAVCALAQTEGEKLVRRTCFLSNSQGTLSLLPSAAMPLTPSSSEEGRDFRGFFGSL